MPSIIPPIITAPTMAPYPYVGPTKQNTDTNVKLIPITIGNPEPTFHIGYN